MITHIVLWNFIEGLTEEQKQEATRNMKSLLEPIKELVPGAIDIQVICNEISSSNREVALISTFESIEALQNYQNHPAHIEAGKYIRNITCDRACMDFE